MVVLLGCLVRQECYRLVVINTLPSDHFEWVMGELSKLSLSHTNTVAKKNTTQTDSTHKCPIINKDLLKLESVSFLCVGEDLFNLQPKINVIFCHVYLDNNKCGHNFLFYQFILFHYSRTTLL